MAALRALLQTCTVRSVQVRASMQTAVRGASVVLCWRELRCVPSLTSSGLLVACVACLRCMVLSSAVHHHPPGALFPACSAWECAGCGIMVVLSLWRAGGRGSAQGCPRLLGSVAQPSSCKYCVHACAAAQPLQA